MKFRFVFPFALALCVALPVYSQRREEREKIPLARTRVTFQRRLPHAANRTPSLNPNAIRAGM